VNIPPGETCKFGGIEIDTGIDENGNGVLDPEEVDQVQYVCNGSTTVIEVSAEPPGANCPTGGKKVVWWFDGDQDGLLDPEEVLQTAFVCNGDAGLVAITGISAEPPGAHCQNGGQKIQSGLDDDKDGVLDPAEVDFVGYVCDPNDTIAPTVVATNPVNGTTGVALNALVTVAFSELISAATLTTSTFTLSGPGGTVPGTVTYLGNLATFQAASPLAVNSVHTATITTGVKDVAGNPLAANAVFTFTTLDGPDVTAPTVGSTTPAAGATSVELSAIISATFSESMEPGTINTSTFSLAGPNGPLAGAVSYGGNTAVFTPSPPLTHDTLYTAKVKGGVGGVADPAGNLLASDHPWTFTTRAQTTNASAPQVAIDRSGNAFAAWLQGNTPVDLFAARFNTATGAWQTEAARDDPLKLDVAQYSLAMNGSGVAFLLWTQDQSGSDRALASRFDGTSWDAPSLIYNFASLDPHIGINDNGVAFAVWSTGNTARADRYLPGSGWEAATSIHNATATTISTPRVVVDSVDGAVAVWIQDSDTYARPFAGTWGNFTNNLDNSTVGDSPRVGIDGSNRVILIGRRLSTTNRLYANRFVSGVWSGQVDITTTTVQLESPELAVDPAGNAIAVWTENDSVYASRYSAVQGTWGAPLEIDAAAAGAAHAPHVGMDISGNAYAVWVQHDGSVDSVYAARYDASSGQWSAPPPLELAAGAAQSPRIAVNDQGDAVAVWIQTVGTQNQVFSSRLID
jgi:hypothetical protein